MNNGYMVYIIPNHYNHSVQYILNTIEFAKTISTIPDIDNIKVEVLAGVRYSKMLSIEYTNITKPTQGMELTKDSGIWEWLVY